MTNEIATTIIIFCTQPFTLRYTHTKSDTSNEAYPINPMPMGVPIVIRDCRWTEIIVQPRLFPAQLRVWTQANHHVEPPPGALT